MSSIPGLSLALRVAAILVTPVLGCTSSNNQSGAPAQTPYGQPSYGQPAAAPTYGQPAPAPTYGQPAPAPTYGQPAPAPTYSPPAAAPAPAPATTVASTPAAPAAPIGSYDVDGSIAAAAMRATPAAIVAELITNLPSATAAKVRGIPVNVVEDPKEVNAYAGCSNAGSAYMAITFPLVLIAARGAEAKAYDELYGTRRYDDLASSIASEVLAQRTIQGPASGFLPLPQALDPRKLARQKQLFDEQIAFVLGHELAHHYRGHTGCANGAASSNLLTPQDLGRLLSNAVPVFNQPNEIDADVNGTYDVLDTGARRQAGTWTEEGALMTLNFFARLESLGVQTVILGFLMTHPLPQIRLPIVQNAAQQWRAAGGHAPAFPPAY